MQQRHSKGLVAAAILLGLLIGACAAGERQPLRLDPDVIRIGSFDFPESEVLAEIYATALEDHGFQVKRFLRLASREVVQPALAQDRLDLVPEYVGSALSFASLGAAEQSPNTLTAHRRLASLLDREAIDVLRPAAAQNKNVFVTAGNSAFRYSLFTLSDIEPIADQLVFGGPPECAQRPLCLPGLEEVYGLHFKDFVPLDASGPLTLAALNSNEVDVALMFSTDPALDDEGLIVLADDKQLQPAENVVPVVRHEVVATHGRPLVALLNSVSAQITTRGLRVLNRQIRDGADPLDLAAEWLENHDL